MDNGMYLDTQLSHDHFERSAFVKEKVDAIADRIITPSMSDEEKLIALDNWFRDEYSYIDGIHDVYGGLYAGGGVCATYARLAEIFCEKEGIECLYVAGYVDNGSGDDPELHAWNKVKVNGKWYYVDYTWNIDHQYFLTETLWEDHKEYSTDDRYFLYT